MKDSLQVETLTSLTPVNELDVALFFSKVADKYLLLDVPGAGTPEMMNCCHSGCDNCAYSRIFDCLTSARAKWIPAYSYRKLIDGRSHTPTWKTVLFGAKDRISKEEFKEKLLSLPRQFCVGLSVSLPSDYEFSEDGLSIIWNKLKGKDSDIEDLTIEEMTLSLQQWYKTPPPANNSHNNQKKKKTKIEEEDNRIHGLDYHSFKIPFAIIMKS
jgi:LRP1 type putative zinc finger protein